MTTDRGHNAELRAVKSNHRGFTIIELVAVMVIVGVLAVFVIPRFNPAGFERYAFRHELLSAVRYAQKTALASGCDVRVQLSAANDSFTVSIRSGDEKVNCNQSSFEALADPIGGGTYSRKGGDGADLQSSGEVTFSGFGEPAIGSLSSISLAGGPDIEIDPITGYVRDG